MPLIQMNKKASQFYTKMSKQAKPLSMMESCLVFQRRNRRIFGDRTSAEQQEPPKVSSCSFQKNCENPTPLKNSKTLPHHLPPVHKQETRQSQSRSKMARDTPRHTHQTVVTSQRQVTQFPNIQGQQRKPQSAEMMTTKLCVARQNDAKENTERSGGRAKFKDDTMIYRQCLAQVSLPVPDTRTTIPQNETIIRHLQPETVLAQYEPGEIEHSTHKFQGAIKQKQRAEAHLPLQVPGTLPRKTTLTKGTHRVANL